MAASPHPPLSPHVGRESARIRCFSRTPVVRLSRFPLVTDAAGEGRAGRSGPSRCTGSSAAIPTRACLGGDCGGGGGPGSRNVRDRTFCMCSVRTRVGSSCADRDLLAVAARHGPAMSPRRPRPTHRAPPSAPDSRSPFPRRDRWTNRSSSHPGDGLLPSKAERQAPGRLDSGTTGLYGRASLSCACVSRTGCPPGVYRRLMKIVGGVRFSAKGRAHQWDHRDETATDVGDDPDVIGV